MQTVSHPDSLFTLDEEPRQLRLFPLASIDHADGELHVEDADMFPQWEPDGDELEEMLRQSIAYEQARKANLPSVGYKVERCRAGWRATVTVGGKNDWTQTYKEASAADFAANQRAQWVLGRRNSA